MSWCLAGRGGGWGSHARERSLAAHSPRLSALPLASFFYSFAVVFKCVRASLSVVSPPWGHRRSRCDQKRGSAAPRRRLAGGVGARASSLCSVLCSPLVGATLLHMMGRPWRLNRRARVHSALAGALMFGGRRSPRVARRRRAWLSGSGGVACIRVCTRSDGACMPSPVVGRCVGVRVVARACECVSLVGARVFVSFGLVAPRSALPRLVVRGGLYTCGLE